MPKHSSSNSTANSPAVNASGKGEWTTAPNMQGFDKFARATAKRLIEQGWVGKRSRNEHLLMRAPDGETTVALCRNNAAPRVRQNTLSPIRRWEDRIQSSTPNVHRVCISR